MLPDVFQPNSFTAKTAWSKLSGWVGSLPVENVRLARLYMDGLETFSWFQLYGFLNQLIAEAEQSTPGHSQRVADLSLRCGVVLGLKPQELRRLYWGGALHDVGKLALDGDVLHKPGPLSADEWELVRQHPIWGYEAVLNILNHLQLAQTVLTHHERWEGGGYPGGLKANEIPLHGRIVAIVDTFDALTTVRSYKQPVTPEQALRIIGAECGKQFDPQLLTKIIASGVLKPVQLQEKYLDVG